jgi:hypothetical protein
MHTIKLFIKSACFDPSGDFMAAERSAAKIAENAGYFCSLDDAKKGLEKVESQFHEEYSCSSGSCSIIFWVTDDGKRVMLAS